MVSGVCPTCGAMFESKRLKKYCSVKCYTSSAQFLEMRSQIYDSRRRKESRACLECGEEVFKRGKHVEATAKFCCKVCYRSYMAKRFDRFVANPETMALPQCYDEFLDREELPCLVEGCGWAGKQLTIHMNAMHGFRAENFKRAAGFNLGTGVVGKGLAEAFQKRSAVGVAIDHDREDSLTMAQETLKERGYVRYRSLECVEHQKKARALQRLMDEKQPETKR